MDTVTVDFASWKREAERIAAMEKRIAQIEAWAASVKRMADETLGDAKASGRGALRLISTSADEILKR